MMLGRVYKAGIVLFSVIAIASCATATRGSHTIFKVETLPEGAKVVTDLVYKGDLNQNAGIKDGETIYYGCEATPCGIKLPRRSDFNVMAVKPGYQPSTYAIVKERNKMEARQTEVTGAGILATGAVVGGLSAASIAAEGGVVTAFLFPPTAVVASTVILAAPVAGAATGIDLASGALIDLQPNPLLLELKPEVSQEETDELVTAFMNSRQKRREIP